MKNQGYLLIVATLLLSSNAFANKEVGNGGGGVIINGKPYVLDLIEAGIQANPFFDPAVSPEPRIRERVKRAFAELPATPVDLIAQKLTEVSKLDRVFAASILQVMEMYLWRSTDLSLAHIPDEDTVIDVDPSAQVQLAARIEHTIEINQLTWTQLDMANKAALVFHEVIYALVLPYSVPRPETATQGGTFFQQSSPFARQVAAFLFSSDMKAKGRDGLTNLIGNKFPQAFTNDCTSIPGALYCSPQIYLKTDSYSVTPNIYLTPEAMCRKNGPSIKTSVHVELNAETFEKFLKFSIYESPDLQLHTYISFGYHVDILWWSPSIVLAKNDPQQLCLDKMSKIWELGQRFLSDFK